MARFWNKLHKVLNFVYTFNNTLVTENFVNVRLLNDLFMSRIYLLSNLLSSWILCYTALAFMVIMATKIYIVAFLCV